MSEMARHYGNHDPEAIADRKVDNAHYAYTRMIGGRPLLTDEEEFALFEQVAVGKEAQAQMDEGHMTEQLATKVALGRMARNHIIEANLRLPFSIAREKYKPSYKMDMVDLASGVNEAMIKIVDKYFDHTQGNKFSTYATHSLKRELGRVVAREGRAFPLPDDVSSHLYRYLGARGKLEGRPGHEPTDEEYAQEANIPLNKMHLVHTALARTITSYDQPIGEDGDPMISRIADTRPDTVSVENQVLVHEGQRTLDNVLSILEKQEENIVRCYYGVGVDHEPMTYPQIGQLLGMRRERVSEIASIAMEKLRTYLSENPEDVDLLRDMLD